MKRLGRIGLGSFAYRYAIGFNQFSPKDPMDTMRFLDEANRLGYEGVQLCENLKYSKLKNDELVSIKNKAEALGLFIEIGMNSLTKQNLEEHIRIAEVLSSKFIRIVVGSPSVVPESDPTSMRYKATEIIKDVLPCCEENNISFGIENHFDLPTNELVQMVKDIDSARVGLIYDSTNGLGFMERSEETFAAMLPYLVSLHLKDYCIKKIEAGYMMSGTVLGDGLLNVEEILKGVINKKPDMSIILEMTVRRQEGRSIEDVISGEQKNIEASTAYLKKMLSQINVNHQKEEKDNG